jgi:hypothetical protein
VGTSALSRVRAASPSRQKNKADATVPAHESGPVPVVERVDAFAWLSLALRLVRIEGREPPKEPRKQRRQPARSQVARAPVCPAQMHARHTAALATKTSHVPHMPRAHLSPIPHTPPPSRTRPHTSPCNAHLPRASPARERRGGLEGRRTQRHPAARPGARAAHSAVFAVFAVVP